MDLQHEIDCTTSGVIQLPYGETIELDTLNIHREVQLRGATMTSSRIKCRRINVTSRSPVLLQNFRLTGPGDGIGLNFDYAFSSGMERLLIEGFPVAVNIRAGNAWDMTRCRINADKIGVLVNNLENGDEGDWSVFGTTIACSDGVNGDAAVLVESSGGGRFVDDKFLGFKFPVLLQTKCDSSVNLFAACSMELYSHMGMPYVDHAAVLSANFELKHELTFDGFHLNTAGYSMWANLLRPLLA